MKEPKRNEIEKLAALREAARIGFDDLDQGRYHEVREEQLDGYIAELGHLASLRARLSGRSKR